MANLSNGLQAYQIGHPALKTSFWSKVSRRQKSDEKTNGKKFRKLARVEEEAGGGEEEGGASGQESKVSWV